MDKMAHRNSTEGIESRASRREFLQLVTMASAAGIVSGLGSARAASRKVTVGAHPWVYAATQPNYDITGVLGEIFADMSAAGLDGIELMHTALRPDDAVERIARLSKEHSLPVIGTSYEAKMWDREQHAAIVEDAKKVVSRLAELGGKTLGTSVGRCPQKKSEAQLDAQAEVLRQVIGICDSHGIDLNLHNHTYEVVDGMHDLRGTLQRIPGVPLGPDLNWLIRGEVDPVDFIEEFGSQIVFLHLRDQNADGTWSEAMGEGDTDFGRIREALDKVGFTGYAIIELAHEGDFKPTRSLRESLRMSREFVRQELGF